MHGYVSIIRFLFHGFSENFYIKHAKADFNVVKKAFKLFYKQGFQIEVFYFVIPDESDSTSNVKRLSAFLLGIDKDIPLHLTGFIPTYRMLDKRETRRNDLLRVLSVAGDMGLNHVYVNRSI
jgi:pyruvate formate lyase activating enzyme